MCKKTSKDTELSFEQIADVQFKKGWNFIKSNLVELQHYGENKKSVMPKKILFTVSSPDFKDVKWYLKRRMDDEQIKAAKLEFELQGE